MTKTIAIIPARGGSKRIPEKNIKLFGGLPLLVHSIQYALANSNLIDAVYVSTDDASIKATALAYGAKVIDRPACLSGDFEPTITAVRHVLENIGFAVDNVVLLQPTNPLRHANLLSECLEKFRIQNTNSLFTVTQSHQKLGKISDSIFVPFNYEVGQRSQDLEPLYFENGLLYLTKASSIFENEIITKDAFPYLVNHIYANVDIDTKDDLEYAEYLYHKL